MRFTFGNLEHMAKDLNIQYNILMLTVRVSLLVDWILPSNDSYITSF